MKLVNLLIPIILSVPLFFFIGQGDFNLFVCFLAVGYLWVGFAVGYEIKDKE